MATVADYPDAVQRIVESDVPADATTTAEVQAAIAAAGGPQINAQDTNGRTVGDNIADVVITEERVIDTIESTGELPTEGKIDAITSAADDYGMGDRVESVSGEVSDRVATVEEVNQAIDAARRSKGDQPTFREDVESAVDSLADRQEFVGESPDQVASEQAREVGAPTRQNFDQAAIQTVTQETVTPSEESGIESDVTTPIPVVRDQSGDVVGVQSAGSRQAAEQVAESVDAEVIGGPEAFGLDQGEGRATLTLDGRPIREVDVE